MKSNIHTSSTWKKIGLGAALLGTLGAIAFLNLQGSGLLSKFTQTNITPSNAATYWQPSGESNPYFSKLNTEYSNKLNFLVTVILGKGKNLSSQEFVSYLNNLDQGIASLEKKSEYAQDEEVLNIIRYISYEIKTVPASIENSVVVSNTSPSTTASSGGGTSSNISSNTTSSTPPAPEVTPSFIKLDKEVVQKVGEVVVINWQLSNAFAHKYCHVIKTHSINGKKGDATVILQKAIDVSQRKNGTVTDTVQKPGNYIYVLNCNDNSDIIPDMYDGLFLSSKSLTFAAPVEVIPATTPSTTASSSGKSQSGVPYSEIKAYVEAVINGTGTDKQKAQTIYDQMSISRVTEEDIYIALETVDRAEIKAYLAKRND